MSADSTLILSKSNDDSIITVRVLLEPSERVRELEEINKQLREQLENADRRAVELQDRLISEMQLSMRLQDEVREYGRIHNDR